MGWARLDDGFHDHPKLIGLPLDAVGLYTLALTWAHRHKGASSGLVGHIPTDLPARLAGGKGKALAARLVEHRLWDVEDGLGGWVIHDFSDYLPAADRPATADEVRIARSEAGRRGAAKRWNGKPIATDSQGDGKLPSDPDGKPMPPTRPVPNPSQKSPSSANADAVFDAFWRHYPRKVGKQDARKVWDRKIRQTDPAEIVAGIRAYLPIYTETATEFIPHPSTWLAQGRWEDEFGLDPDAVLGRDLWQLPSPPDGVEPGTSAFTEWAQLQRAGRKAERESEARGVVERRRGA